MTTVEDSNIHCVAVEGTFDDCQDLVKASFNSPEFRDRVKLGAVNSINWCRVLAQTTYYFWSYLRVTDDPQFKDQLVGYSVPTGNFGDILAGFYSKEMGLPVGKLIVATSPIEVERLHALYDRGLQNKVPGLCLVSRDEMKQISPHCEGLEAIWSPNTGIVNYPDVVRLISLFHVSTVSLENHSK